MLGERLEQLYPPKAETLSDAICFEAENLSLEGKFADVSIQARKGEIFGLFDLVGSGIDEISKVLFGAIAQTSGTLRKDGKILQLQSPGAAIRAGIFLVPAIARQKAF